MGIERRRLRSGWLVLVSREESRVALRSAVVCSSSGPLGYVLCLSILHASIDMHLQLLLITSFKSLTYQFTCCILK